MNVGNNFDPNHLIELANYKMPFGKYKGYYLVKIPEYYYTWYKRKGFPDGKLGRMMMEMDEIKINGLEALILKLIRK
ncbi:MAG: DUF3820 family protein [Flavobacteriales bacterium]|jgi:uncharacterized protein (DUF3820 family)|tara:strand:+ start:809 stop:1039 length:231 start_codon:yes stop_codon:yes gene_type:complete